SAAQHRHRGPGGLLHFGDVLASGVICLERTQQELAIPDDDRDLAPQRVLELLVAPRTARRPRRPGTHVRCTACRTASSTTFGLLLTFVSIWVAPRFRTSAV